MTEQKAGGGSIDGAIQLFAKSEHDYLKKELAKWASDMINEEISLPFSSSLASGVKLCKLVEKVSRVHVAGVHPEKKCTVVNGSQAEISRAQIFKTENLNYVYTDEMRDSLIFHIKSFFLPSPFHLLLHVLTFKAISGSLQSD
eukprot:jgi/Bigna1/146595/aug1.117_g21303